MYVHVHVYMYDAMVASSRFEVHDITPRSLIQVCLPACTCTCMHVWYTCIHGGILKYFNNSAS